MPTSSFIHPTSIIEPGAQIADQVNIGPYCVVGGHVALKRGVTLKSHVCVAGDTVIDEDTIIYPFASIGQAPQDLKFSGEESRTRIGKRCKIREYVTIQAGTEADRLETTVGDDILAMVGTHIAHDCVVGNHVILANYVNLAGHVHVGNHAVIGGMSAVQQFVRIGEHAMIGGMSGVDKDVIPYGLVMGERAFLNGLNLIGLRRHKVSNQDIRHLMKAYDLLFDKQAIHIERFMHSIDDKAAHHEGGTLLKTLAEFLSIETTRPYCVPKN